MNVWELKLLPGVPLVTPAASCSVIAVARGLSSALRHHECASTAVVGEDDEETARASPKVHVLRYRYATQHHPESVRAGVGCVNVSDNLKTLLPYH